MDILHAMRTFVRVVDAGSFTAAAQQFDTSTAQVSRLVSELENHLQARLLHRTTRRLALTEAGQRYLEQSREILGQVELARVEASGAHLVPRGRLRVHSTIGLGIQLLATLAGHYNTTYPDVNLDLVLSQRQPDLLEDNLDVVITLSRELPNSELIAQKLGTVFHVVCASPIYLRQHGAPKVPADLKQHRCLRLADPVFADSWSFVGNGTEQTILPGETFKVNVAEAMSSAAEAGMGICLLPDYVAVPALQRGSLVRLLPQFRLQEKSIYALYPSRRFLDAKIKTWVEFLKQELPHAFFGYHQVLQNPEYWA
ncbi:LysR family transcriptional regulator [Stutzerimonas stutzeri]|uniref:LysR family transcriptional regulator n=1 Tax=Stutzerimonas stutzeri TaxID=316 RepID=W8RUD5_STUST|nr:LysR family transcriptional regulator [Stutzerimonas stutzeri]AHL75656.1 LysR family transcriptional regulator [Stutzerimonas stutzeri]MCQ4327764.1 LysR family transcriptional regulator [Stutzerimonas stutzeri]